jgi:hypothetical protein
MNINSKSEEFELVVDQGLFKGLAKSNLKFHQCICELIDNSIAACNGKKFDITVILSTNLKDKSLIDVYIVDKSGGMDKETLKKAINIGNSATTTHRLNEHGFGLKNALAVLTYGGEYNWNIWTKAKNAPIVLHIKSPFQQKMSIDEVENFPELPYEQTNDKISTIIHAEVKKELLKSMQYVGRKSEQLEDQVEYLYEHLGVSYRGFLDDKKGGDIKIIAENQSEEDGFSEQTVRSIKIPFKHEDGEKKLKLKIRDKEIEFKVKYGTLKEENESHKIYYRGYNTQKGLDIQIGNRVIATGIFNEIWTDIAAEDKNDGYNTFVGEVIIPEQIRGSFSTINNKTSINEEDDDWKKLFKTIGEKINPIRSKNWRPSEEYIRKKLIEGLKSTPSKPIVDSRKVWGTGVEIDVYYEYKDEIFIYEIKIGKAAPLHLYQLKMYWDGLVIQGKQPTKAILMIEEIGKNIETMIDEMNTKLKDPSGNNYNFVFEKYDKKKYEENR